jgi:hypothetical protein
VFCTPYGWAHNTKWSQHINDDDFLAARHPNFFLQAFALGDIPDGGTESYAVSVILKIVHLAGLLRNTRDFGTSCSLAWGLLRPLDPMPPIPSPHRTSIRRWRIKLDMLTMMWERTLFTGFSKATLTCFARGCQS